MEVPGVLVLLDQAGPHECREDAEAGVGGQVDEASAMAVTGRQHVHDGRGALDALDRLHARSRCLVSRRSTGSLPTSQPSFPYRAVTAHYGPVNPQNVTYCG